MRVRAIFWIVALAYTGFLLTGQGLQTFNSLSITEGFLGAITGFLLAIMFTLREERRRRPALIAHSIAEILQDGGGGPFLLHTFHRRHASNPAITPNDSECERLVSTVAFVHRSGHRFD